MKVEEVKLKFSGGKFAETWHNLSITFPGGAVDVDISAVFDSFLDILDFMTKVHSNEGSGLTIDEEGQFVDITFAPGNPATLDISRHDQLKVHLYIEQKQLIQEFVNTVSSYFEGNELGETANEYKVAFEKFKDTLD
jgi:hypothetical protein